MHTRSHPAHMSRGCLLEATYLDTMDNVLKGWRALGPRAHQPHCPVKVLDVLPIHLQEWGQLL